MLFLTADPRPFNDSNNVVKLKYCAVSLVEIEKMIRSHAEVDYEKTQSSAE
jgi:hypothetical protein